MALSGFVETTGKLLRRHLGGLPQRPEQDKNFLFLFLFKLATQILPDRKVGLFKILKTTNRYDMQTINHYSSPSFDRRRVFTAPALLIATLFLLPCGLQAAVVRVGNPADPRLGATFDIFALQGLNDSGVDSLAFAVNRNFEFDNSIGVTIDLGGGKLKDFGIGLYQDAAKATHSTGLEVIYDNPIFAESATATVEDFDISSKDSFFKSTKVEPRIAFLLGNSIIDIATPADIFPNLVATAAGPGGAKDDTWNINFAGLAGKLGLTGQPISGFILFADQAAGEVANSDPYLLVSVGPGTQVPEPATIALIIGTAGVGAAYRARRRFLH
jgi:hypothetical protein